MKSSFFLRTIFVVAALLVMAKCTSKKSKRSVEPRGQSEVSQGQKSTSTSTAFGLIDLGIPSGFAADCTKEGPRLALGPFSYFPHTGYAVFGGPGFQIDSCGNQWIETAAKLTINGSTITIANGGLTADFELDAASSVHYSKESLGRYITNPSSQVYRLHIASDVTYTEFQLTNSEYLPTRFVSSGVESTAWAYDSQNRLVSETRDGVVYKNLTYQTDQVDVAYPNRSIDNYSLILSAGKVISFSQGAESYSLNYDANGNVSEMIDSANSTEIAKVEYYDSTGVVKSIRLDGETVLIASYVDDGTETTTEVVNAPKSGAKYVHRNSDGKLVRTEGKGGAQITYTYGTNGLFSSVTQTYGSDSSTVTYQYDAYGNTTSIDRDGDVQTFTYANGPRGIPATMPGVTYSYNSNWQPISESSRGGTTTYAYDASGRVVSETFPNGVSSTYTYDGAGTHRMATQQVTYANSETETKTFTWDSNKRLTGHASGVHSHARAFDTSGRVSSVSATNNGVTSSHQYAFDTTRPWLPTSVTSNNGASVVRAFSAEGRLTSETTNQPNGDYIVEAWAFDAQGVAQSQDITFFEAGQQSDYIALQSGGVCLVDVMGPYAGGGSDGGTATAAAATDGGMPTCICRDVIPPADWNNFDSTEQTDADTCDQTGESVCYTPSSPGNNQLTCGYDPGTCGGGGAAAATTDGGMPTCICRDVIPPADWNNFDSTEQTDADTCDQNGESVCYTPSSPGNNQLTCGYDPGTCGGGSAAATATDGGMPTCICRDVIPPADWNNFDSTEQTDADTCDQNGESVCYTPSSPGNNQLTCGYDPGTCGGAAAAATDGSASATAGTGSDSGGAAAATDDGGTPTCVCRIDIPSGDWSNFDSTEQTDADTCDQNGESVCYTPSGQYGGNQVSCGADPGMCGGGAAAAAATGP